jgi:hypothetical protein
VNCPGVVRDVVCDEDWRVMFLDSPGPGLPG